MRWLLILFIIVFISCPDALRDNPYDINNPFSQGGIFGRIKTYALRPVESAKIILNDSIITYSDENGFYIFKNIKPGFYSIKVQKNNYESLYDSIIVKSGIIDTIDFTINSIPHFTFIKIFSRYSKWYDESKLNEVLIYTVVTDYDYILDVKNLLMINENETISGKFVSFADPEGFSGYYKGKFLKSDIHSFENDTIYLLAEDKKGSLSYKISFIKNVVDTFTNLISPAAGETLILPYKFQWNKFKNVNYILSIWKRENGIDEPSKIYENIGNNDTSMTISNFTSGFYEWSVYIVNNNGNMGGRVGWFMIK